MTQTQTDFKATLETVRTLHRQGILPKDAFKRALQLIGHTPQRGDWVKFVNVLLLGLGSLLLISGIFFFLAYNWTDLSRFARFGTVEVAMGGIGAHRWQDRTHLLGIADWRAFARLWAGISDGCRFLRTLLELGAFDDWLGADCPF